MKKGLLIASIIIVIITVILGLQRLTFLKLNPKEIEETFSDTYLEEIPENAKPFLEAFDNQVLKTKDEIIALNNDIFKKSGSMFDLKSIKKITKEEIKNYINTYTMPTLPKYNDDMIVTTEEKKAIQQNRNLDMIKDITKVQHGVIVNRANLKSFPTNIHFYDIEGVKNFDSLQETELLLNTEVIILHESSDKEWYFVMSETYLGWVEKNKIALLKDDDRDFFIQPKDFLVVTASSIKIDNKILDMSVKLPYIKANEKGYEAYVPIKGDDQYVKKEKITLPRNEAHRGYLPYTKKNVIIEAFKYEGTPYSWAGQDENVDCSSYVSNIYRTFGIKFPRNTKDQNKSLGKIIALKDKSSAEKLAAMKDLAPALLYQEGHVMLYIGDLDNKSYIIHASGDMKNLKVLVSELNNSSYLSKIYQINTL